MSDDLPDWNPPFYAEGTKSLDNPFYLESFEGDWKALLPKLPLFVQKDFAQFVADGMSVGIGEIPGHGMFVIGSGQGPWIGWCEWWPDQDKLEREWADAAERRRKRENLEAEGDDILTKEWPWWEEP